MAETVSSSTTTNCCNFVNLNAQVSFTLSNKPTNSSQDPVRIFETSSSSGQCNYGKTFEEMEPQHANCNGATSCYSESNTDIVHVSEDDLKLFEHQVSGHGTEEKGLLKHKNGWVLKPLQAPPMGVREVSFYQQIHQEHQQEDCFLKLKRFVPNYHGVAYLTNNSHKTNGDENGISPSDSRRRYLLLEDIIQGFEKPCVADIKIGSQTWSPDASEAKIKQERSKYKGTKFPLGMCLTGMHYYDVHTGESCKMSKEFCKLLDPATLKIAIEKFFNKENSILYETLVNLSIDKLRDIEKVFDTQKSFRLYGSSILIAYDANYFASKKQDAIKLESDMEETPLNNIPLRVFMIDFAHFHPSDENEVSHSLDENYLFGLKNLIKILCDTLNVKE